MGTPLYYFLYTVEFSLNTPRPSTKPNDGNLALTPRFTFRFYSCNVIFSDRIIGIKLDF